MNKRRRFKAKRRREMRRRQSLMPAFWPYRYVTFEEYRRMYIIDPVEEYHRMRAMIEDRVQLAPKAAYPSTP